ncbi:MAG: methyltransferase domain-containing protein [Magnetococcales bacterium]|nr:methyltransferase domain-containing protein [Magnetococcales bacterium]
MDDSPSEPLTQTLTPPPPRLDARRVRRAISRVTSGDPSTLPLLPQVSRLLVERLEEIRLEPARILELGCRSGTTPALLHARYPKATLISGAFTTPLPPRPESGSLFWRRPLPGLVLESHRLPFATGCFDLVVSSLALHWWGALLPSLREIRRVMADNALLLFTVPGSETLRELNQALTSHDTARGGRVWPRIAAFPDLDELGRMMQGAGLSLVVVDREKITPTVPSVRDLALLLRRLGAGNHHHLRPSGLSGSAWFNRMERHYRLQAGLDERQALPVTIDILFGHGWKNPTKS